jgi:hypothetical protein
METCKRSLGFGQGVDNNFWREFLNSTFDVSNMQDVAFFLRLVLLDPLSEYY